MSDDSCLCQYSYITPQNVIIRETVGQLSAMYFVTDIRSIDDGNNIPDRLLLFVRIQYHLIDFITINTEESMLGCKSDQVHPDFKEHSEVEEREVQEDADSEKDRTILKPNVEKFVSLDESKVDLVWRRVWPHLNCYLLPVDDYTRWFLMDEVHNYLSILPFPL